MPLPSYTDLAPGILRQRLVVEGYPSKSISDDAIRRYLTELSKTTGMKSLMEPVTHKSPMYGWAGWIHWETSGAHFYAWEQPVLFFSVDIYTCKQFDPKVVVHFTRDYFQASEITARDFSSTPPTISAAELAAAPCYKYTLREPELQVLSERLLSEQPPRTNDSLVLYRLQGTDELSNLGRHIEHQVFEEKFNNDDAAMRRIYNEYEAASSFYVVMDQSIGRPIGAMRIIDNSPAGFMALKDAEKFAGISAAAFMQHYGIESLDTVWDVGTLAIPRQYRNRDEHLVVAMLYRGAHLRAHLEGKTHYIALVDSDLRRTFGLLGYPFYAMMGSSPFAYEGSADTLAVCGVAKDFFPTVMDQLRRADDRVRPILQYFAQRFVHGHDIDHRLMFEHSIWPGGTCTTPSRRAALRESRL